MIKILIAVLGLFLVAIVLWDGFETIVFPRRVTRKMRLTRLFYRCTWLFWSKLVNTLSSGKRIETYLSFYGPLSLLFLMSVWATVLVFGFGLLHWIAGSTQAGESLLAVLWNNTYLSGTDFFTLGLGDVTPQTIAGRFLTVVEAGLGFGFLALIIGYLPALNQSFSRREVNITMLDARAGSPPTAMEMLERHSYDPELADLRQLLHTFEGWSAELLESHLSYPVLAYFRSQHDNQSWISTLTAILDTCSLIMTYMDKSCKNQAELTFAMARHAVVDIAIILHIPPAEPAQDRLSSADLDRLKVSLIESGFSLSTEAEADQKLRDLRHMYEPYLKALADYLCLYMPPWLPDSSHIDNWQTSAWGSITISAEKVIPTEHKHRHF